MKNPTVFGMYFLGEVVATLTVFCYDFIVFIFFKIEEKCTLIQMLDKNLKEMEKQCIHYYEQYLNAKNTIEYLRDVNLETEVEKFNLMQDISILESRLLKYQHNAIKKCICGLKTEVRKLRLLKKHHEVLINYLKKELKECSEELTALKTVLETEAHCLEQENQSLSIMVKELEKFSCGLRCQLDVAESNLVREKKINQVNTNRIEELQSMIGAKNLEMCTCNDICQNVKTELELSLDRNQKLEQALSELQNKLKVYAKQNAIQEEKTDICHDELDICLDNLQDVKHKIRAQNQLLNQKVQECTQLEADCKIQCNNAEIYKRDLEHLRIRYRDEVIDLKHSIRELKDKVVNSENKAGLLNEETKQAQAMLVDSVQQETQLQKEFSEREHILNQKIQNSQSEQMRLIDLVTQLEEELALVKNDVNIRDQQLEVLKNNLMQMTNENNKQCNLAQEEINSLKNEINLMLQQQANTKPDNDKLEEQLKCLKCCLQLQELQNKTLKEELDRCQSEMQTINVDKVYLEQKNEQLSRELERMQCILHSKTANIVKLEMELVEMKTANDELRIESHNVVSSVKAWLEEQKLINLELTQKLQRKNALISKYEQEREAVSCPEAYYPCESYPRQRGGTVNQRQINSPPPTYNKSWSLGSRGSGSESPTSSASTQADWYDYGDTEYHTISDQSSPRLWLHRVESMTEELQRSNRYWKKKINENEFMVTKDK